MKGKIAGRITLLLIFAALAVCVFGAVTGQADAVFRKAAAICMECIGLG